MEHEMFHDVPYGSIRYKIVDGTSEEHGHPHPPKGGVPGVPRQSLDRKREMFLKPSRRTIGDRHECV